MVVDVRSETAIQDSVEQTVKHFGGIDILINNASAISLTGTQAETNVLLILWKKIDVLNRKRTVLDKFDLEGQFEFFSAIFPPKSPFSGQNNMNIPQIFTPGPRRLR